MHFKIMTLSLSCVRVISSSYLSGGKPLLRFPSLCHVQVAVCGYSTLYSSPSSSLGSSPSHDDLWSGMKFTLRHKTNEQTFPRVYITIWAL